MAEVDHGSFNQPFLHDLPAGAPLEGFLFPDTFDLPATATAHDLIALQLNDFEAKAVPVLTSAHLTAYQTVTVASILSREVRYPADLAPVSGVIANRLAAGQDLQLDSTVFYGLGITNEPTLTPAELAKDTPYNTYIHSGLPPTPIANPGVADLTAAAHPATTAALYFITDCSGHLHLSNTFAEQQVAIATYLSHGCG